MPLVRSETVGAGLLQSNERIEAALRIAAITAFGVLIAFGCVLRFVKLTGVGLWYDELWTVVGASHRPFMEMYREWILGDAHPPTYFVLYFLWLKVVPATEFWVRIPNAIAGVITVAYLLFGTRRVLTRNERITSASLVSLSYTCIFYALTVKQYSAMMLFATVATVAYLEIAAAERVDRRQGMTLGASCLALAYLNHFGMVYACVLLGLLALTFRGNREALKRTLRIAAVFSVGYLPIAYFLYIELRYSIDAWQPYDIHTFLSELLPSLFFNDPVFVARAFGVLAVFLLALMATRRQTRDLFALSRRNRHLAAIVLAFFAFMLALGMFEPIFFVRYFLVMVPALFLGLGILMAAAFPIGSWLAILPLVFFVHAATVQFRSVEGIQREQWDRSVDYVLASKQSNEPIYVLGAKMDRTEFDYLRAGDTDDVFMVRNLKFYRYYFRRRGAEETAQKLQVVQPTVESVRDLAKRYHQTGATVYVLAGHRIQFSDEALAALEQATRRIDVTKMYGTLVYRFTF